MEHNESRGPSEKATNPETGRGSKRGMGTSALRRVPNRIVEIPISRLAVAVLGSILGGMIGGIAGYLLMSMAVMSKQITNDWGLAPIVGLVIGGIGGAVAGWIGGFVQGATLGSTDPRLDAARLYGGMVSGAMVVFSVSVRSIGIDWGRRGEWIDLLEMLLLATATSALGTVLASVSVGRLAHAFANRVKKRAGAKTLDG